MALRNARARQAARRAGREEFTAENPPPDAIVVEDDSEGPSIAGMEGVGDICEAVIFTKDDKIIDFKYVKNNC